MTPRLPPGPPGGRVRQAVAFHRDPLRMLETARARYGDVFTLNLGTAGPAVVLASAEVAAGVPESDPARSHAGAARRGVLPMASDTSVFGADGDAHRAARERIDAAFGEEAVAARRPGIEAIARAHVARWPRRRPFRLLPRMRAIADEVFVREILGADDPQLARDLGSLLHTPGNPPFTVAGPEDGLVGRVLHAVYRRRRAPVAARISAARGTGRGVIALADRGQDDDALVEELLSLLMAAQEPMAAALTWTTLCLANGLDEGDFDASVREALRLHPSALASLRTLTEPMDAGGHRLPAGTTVMVPLPLLQRDAGGPWLAFGAGARRCIGQALAWEELRAVVPLVLEQVGPRPLGPQPEKMVLRATILVPRRSGLVRASRASCSSP